MYPIRIIITIFTISLLLSTSLPSQPLNPDYEINSPRSSTPLTRTDQKIQEIINIINATLIQSLLIDLVAIGPRMTSTYGCEKAGEFIFDTLLSYGLQTTKYAWSDFGNRWHPGYFNSYNIEGIHPAKNPISDEIILFNAHYDTVEDTVGANDDGSGVIAVLAAAYALSQFHFNRSLYFVTFSGEEIGLLGSKHYVKQLYENQKNILVELNADMIGKATTKKDGRGIRLSHTEDTQWIIDQMNIINQSTDQFHIDITGTYPLDRTAKRGYSDYYFFIRYGYEAIAFWETAQDPYMHTPQDDLSNVNISYLVNTTRLIATTMARLADETQRPLKVTIASPEKGALYIQGRKKKQYTDDQTIIIDNKWIYLDIESFDAEIQKVEFYLDDSLKHTCYDIPYVWNMNLFSFGSHQLKVIAYDSKDRTSTDQITMKFFNPIRSN